MQQIWAWDLEGFRAIHLGWHRDWLDPVFWTISTSGLGYVQGTLILLLAIRKPFRKWVLPLGIGAALGLTANIVKPLIPRMRPSNLAEAVPQESFYYSAFPSGHTTSAFALATMIWFIGRRVEKPWMGYVAMLWASLVGVSRIYRGVHWPTDVLGGACLGVAATCLVVLAWGKKLGVVPLDDAQPERQTPV